MRVAIIGGGINGYSCALMILDRLKYNKANEILDVTVISDAFTPNTTGDGSAGLWGPYLLGGTSTAKVYQWSKSTHDFLERLWLSEDAGEAGVCLLPVIRVTTTPKPVEDFWKDIVYGCTPLSQVQLNELDQFRGKKFTSGIHFMTYTSEPIRLLPYLMKRFHAKGGKTIKTRVEDFNQFNNESDYEVIINCTGLGSREMINDVNMYPVRGQVARVKANWMYYVLLDESDDGNYIIPNTESVVLGGTKQKDDYNIEVSNIDKRAIVDGCCQLVPPLKNAQHLFDWVGLRPGREVLRLEAANQGDKIIIHNYGHGGSGVTLAWGCAEEVLQILQNEIEKRKPLKSKL